jgi:regulator of protease activity HflC (stomatin/prohibitin superfamily)
MATINSEKVMAEKIAKSVSGFGILVLLIILALAATAGIVVFCIDSSVGTPGQLTKILFGVSLVVYCIVIPLLSMGLKILKPQEALVLTLFGNYFGTLRGAGFFFVNPFVRSFGPGGTQAPSSGKINGSLSLSSGFDKDSKKNIISLKISTLNNDQQKINDEQGNPIVIGIAVIWRVVNTAKAMFNVDNYHEYLSIQSDAALRNIVRLYPYDSAEAAETAEKTLRGSSAEIAEKLKNEIQSKVEVAGLEIVEARITHLSYAQEIAAIMLQRQQASAIIAARQMIVDGAVGMVEMALAKLSDKHIVDLDEERKAAMVSNLLVVLCSNKESVPVINSGSLY